MNIIKKGDPKQLKETKQFECDKCGCVFEAEKGEYTSDMQYNDLYFYCKCPCCGNSARFKCNVRGAGS